MSVQPRLFLLPTGPPGKNESTLDAPINALGGKRAWGVVSSKGKLFEQRMRRGDICLLMRPACGRDSPAVVHRVGLIDGVIHESAEVGDSIYTRENRLKYCMGGCRKADLPFEYFVTFSALASVNWPKKELLQNIGIKDHVQSAREARHYLSSAGGPQLLTRCLTAVQGSSSSSSSQVPATPGHSPGTPGTPSPVPCPTPGAVPGDAASAGGDGGLAPVGITTTDTPPAIAVAGGAPSVPNGSGGGSRATTALAADDGLAPDTPSDAEGEVVHSGDVVRHKAERPAADGAYDAGVGQLRKRRRLFQIDGAVVLKGVCGQRLRGGGDATLAVALQDSIPTEAQGGIPSDHTDWHSETQHTPALGAGLEQEVGDGEGPMARLAAHPSAGASPLLPGNAAHRDQLRAALPQVMPPVLEPSSGCSSQHEAQQAPADRAQCAQSPDAVQRTRQTPADAAQRTPLTPADEAQNTQQGAADTTSRPKPAVAVQRRMPPDTAKLSMRAGTARHAVGGMAQQAPAGAAPQLHSTGPAAAAQQQQQSGGRPSPDPSDPATAVHVYRWVCKLRHRMQQFEQHNVQQAQRIKALERECREGKEERQQLAQRLGRMAGQVKALKRARDEDKRRLEALEVAQEEDKLRLEQLREERECEAAQREDAQALREEAGRRRLEALEVAREEDKLRVEAMGRDLAAVVELLSQQGRSFGSFMQHTQAPL